MLKRKLVPSPLIDASQRKPVRINDQPPVIRFRAAYILTRILALGVTITWLKARRKLTDRKTGELIRDFCQQMGVLWIKVGQLISIRRDLVAQDVCDELAKLQDLAEGFPIDAAHEILQLELGSKADKIFRRFEEVPFAAASISQIHKAQLRHDGTWVAVKIQRPGIQATFDKDMRLIRWAARLLNRLSIIPHARWNDLVWEIDQVMQEELDYRFEAANLRRMKKSLRQHNVYVPTVFNECSTRRVLVMEFIQGVTMADFIRVAQTDPGKLAAWLEKNDINPRSVARRLIHSHMRQAYEDNLFHCDLHPGNIVLLRNSRFAFIDFGSIGFVEQGFLKKYDMYTQALNSRNFGKMADLYMLFAVDLPPINLSELKDEFVRVVQNFDTRRRVRELPYHERSLGTLQQELVRLFGKYQIALDWTFLRIVRTWFTMDMSLCVLMPDADLGKLLSQYYRQRERRLRRKLVQSGSRDNGLLRAAFDIPRIAVEQTVYQGAVVRRLSLVFEGTTTKFSRAIASGLGWLAVLLVGLSVFLLLVFLHQYQPRIISPISTDGLDLLLARVAQLDYQVWAIVFIVAAYTLWWLLRLKKRFEQEEVKLPGA